MKEDELRKFCIEQAILIFTHRKDIKGLGMTSTNPPTIFELSEYIRLYINEGLCPNISFYITL